ncbi:MAG: DUF799 domain-containing protein [Campylobacter sp.]|nr:DUF799 domain-containing protein [Campylobacter sp.]
MRNFAIFIACLFLFSGCVKQPTYDYTAHLSENPRSILLLLPQNDSPEVKGAAAVLAHSVAPLSEAGYYIFSPALSYEVFRQNGVAEAHDIHQLPINKLKNIFGCDAVLYINISKFGSNYQLVNSQTAVIFDAKLVSANTGNTLWEQNGSGYVENSNNNGGGGGLMGLLVNIVSAAVSQVANDVGERAFDITPYATANAFRQDCSTCLLRGQRSPKFRQDLQLQK